MNISSKQKTTQKHTLVLMTIQFSIYSFTIMPNVVIITENTNGVKDVLGVSSRIILEWVAHPFSKGPSRN